MLYKLELTDRIFLGHERQEVVERFTIGECTYEIAFYPNPLNPHNWSTGFEIIVGPRQALGNPMGITGTGNAFKVFRTVIDIMTQFVGKHNPKQISFASLEENRTSLYRKMLLKYAESWGVSILDTINDEGGLEGTEFFLTKK